jgi:hypothetical protein
VFAPLAEAAGIQAPPGQRAPRLHDLRHVFAVATLLDWYRDGGDVQARLPVLSTWLGHVDPKSTYWYLQAVPELLALAAGRLGPAGEEALGFRIQWRRKQGTAKWHVYTFIDDRPVRSLKAKTCVGWADGLTVRSCSLAWFRGAANERPRTCSSPRR